jgi:hypothetical protein
VDSPLPHNEARRIGGALGHFHQPADWLPQAKAIRSIAKTKAKGHTIEMPNHKLSRVMRPAHIARRVAAATPAAAESRWVDRGATRIRGSIPHAWFGPRMSLGRIGRREIAAG